MKILSTCLLLLAFNAVVAQSNYAIIDKMYDEIPKELKKTIEEENYQLNSSFYINGYALISKQGKRTFLSKSGEILDKEFGFRTNMTKENLFFVAQPVEGVNDYGKLEVEKYVNIQAYNASGNPVTSEIGNHSNYYFSSNMLKVYDYYEAQNTDYFTIHTNVPDGQSYKIREGLINGKGDIVLHPKFSAVKQLFQNYFLVRKATGYFQITNLDDQSVDTTQFDSYKTYTDMPNVQRGGEVIAFDSKVIVSEAGSSKWGIYDFIERKWTSPADYDEIKAINTGRKLDDIGYKQVLFTDVFLVRKGDEWGAIDPNNNLLIPIQYSKIIYDTNRFEVFNNQGKRNYFDLTTGSELFDKFYDKIYVNYDLKDIVSLTSDGQLGLYDMSTKSYLIDPSEGYIDYKNANGGINYLLIRRSADGRKDETLYSLASKKIIISGLRGITDVGRKFALLNHFNGTRSVIDMSAKEIVPPRKYYGRVQYSHGMIYFYDRAGKRQKVAYCYKQSGEMVDAKECNDIVNKK